MKSISIVNLKGGVGKTVTAVNLAAILATDYEKRVLLVDVDHQGNASRYCGVNTEERGGLAALLTGGAVCYDEVVEMATMSGVDVIPADMSLATLGVDGEYTSQMAVRAMRDLRDAVLEDDSYDYVIFDCPPAFNAASAAALLASDEVIIPIKLDAFSLRGLANVRRQIENIKRINSRINIAGALITMWRNVPVVLDAEAALRDSGLLPVFQTVIRRTDKVDEMTFRQVPIMVSSPYSAAGYDYRNFVQELLEPQLTMDDVEGGADNGI